MKELVESALWALEYFAAYDESNSKVHCAPVRYSPITMRLAEALEATGLEGNVIDRVMSHHGTYELDPGR